ncbi:discoidin domain-containing protein [Actinoplanes bogorensis]|uniref:Discoidin domain-containing protein n=1 Tax=Paractinoplanes bogorensis TaxID=1610840 RepID=A0ABS5YI39_9ACTN|nr:discoidin domain-containing protein [Actinoplanes bogorensis]MBU2662706.1 discoidin domain-containing protein [Actinoplanes bogorensis]
MILASAGGLAVAFRAGADATVPAPSVPLLAIPTNTVTEADPAVTSSPSWAAPSGAVPSPSLSASPAATITAPGRPAVTGRANPSGANLALTGKVTASSIEGSPYPASKAVDGDPSTRWSSGFAEPQWIKVDLGERHRLTEVTLIWEHAYAVAYQIDISIDGKTWRSIYTTNAGQGGTVVADATGTVARQVRVLATKRSNQYGFSLFEFQIR